MKKRRFKVALATCIATISMSMMTYGAGWEQGSGGRWWQNDDGTYPANGWVWLDDNYDGVSECYYFNSDGYILSNTITPDNYTVDADGAWVSDGVVQTRRAEQSQEYTQEQDKNTEQSYVNGWNIESGGWKYYENNKAVTNKWKRINGKKYYFDSDGVMLTGFQDIDDNTYYFGDNGDLSTKSFNLDGIHYEVDKDGVILSEEDEEDWREEQRNETASTNRQSSGNTSSNSSDNRDHSMKADTSDYASVVFEIVNREREAAGKGTLEWDDALAECADERAQELSEKYSHTRPDGTSCFSIFDEYDVDFGNAGENIAQGYRTPEAVMDGWMNSSGHRANILNGNFEKIGVGFYYDGQYHWVQMFTD